MAEKLLNVKEVCRYLGISETALRKLVDKGEIPAYRLGGKILRFRKDQVDHIRAKLLSISQPAQGKPEPIAGYTGIERIKDFFYFNDFYILSAIISLVLLAVIFFT